MLKPTLAILTTLALNFYSSIAAADMPPAQPGFSLTIYSTADPANFDPQDYARQEAQNPGYYLQNPLPGFGVVREMVGHGVGREMHEEPQIPNFGRKNSGEKIKAGMTLAIEPMVNLGTYRVKTLSDGWTVVTTDNQPSAHFEHTVLTTDSGPEILTIPRAS